MLQRGILLALFWAVPVQSFVSAVFSASTRERDVFGQFVWVEQGDYGRWVEYATLFLISALLGFAFVQASRNNNKSITVLSPGLVLVGFLIVISVLLNFSAWGVQDAIRLIIFLGCCAYFLREKISEEAFRDLRTSSVILICSLLVFLVVNSSYAQGPCRVDKCSPAGFLLNGYFPHENFFALVVFACYPLLSTLNDSRWRLALQIMAGAMILASGARTVYIAFAIYLILSLPFFRRAIPFVPFMLTLVSLLVFSLVRGFDLSGRGLVYEIVAESLKSGWLLGSGPSPLANAYNSGLIPFLAYHEHGIAPYLLGRFGVVIFLSILILFWSSARKWRTENKTQTEILHILPFTATALTFASETTLQFNISSAFTWAFVIFLAGKAVSKN
jgi:hypothetical protein